MGTKIIAAAILTVFVAAPALADGYGKGQMGGGANGAATGTQTGGSLSTGQGEHDVVKGDTMWDLSGHYWNNKFSWPRMWSFNPQVHNPHWIFPGQKLFLSEPSATPGEGDVREVKLVVEKLVPEGQTGGSAAAAAPGKTEAANAEAAKASADKAVADAAEEMKKKSMVRVIPDRSQDYLSVERPQRVGTIGNKQAVKILSAKSEEVQFAPAGADTVKVGDRLTIFDDSREISHPLSGQPVGRQVRVLGAMVVTYVDKDTAWGKVFESYEAIEDGHGLMPYREPIVFLEKSKTNSAVNGVVVAGYQKVQLFTNEDAIFLDKGTEDGIVPGALVTMSYPAGPYAAEGYTENLRVPMARAIVISAQAKTCTAWIIDSAKAVEPGFRFTASADSP